MYQTVITEIVHEVHDKKKRDISLLFVAYCMIPDKL